MKKCFVLLNHPLTEDQENDLRNNWGVDAILPLPENLRNIWGNIDPEHNDLVGVGDQLTPIFNWIEQVMSEDDLMVVQGEISATITVFSWNLHRYLIKNEQFLTLLSPIELKMGDTKIVTFSDKSIEKTKTFKHVKFRQLD